MISKHLSLKSLVLGLEGWLMIKSLYCSSTGLEFRSQYLQAGSSLVTPITGDMTPGLVSAGTVFTCMYKPHTGIDIQIKVDFTVFFLLASRTI